MKNIVTKNKKTHVETIFKLNDGMFTMHNLLINEQFNNCFINISPNTAKKIPKQESSTFWFTKTPYIM